MNDEPTWRQRLYEMTSKFILDERERCALIVERARVAANWNEREALAKMIRDGKRLEDLR